MSSKKEQVEAESDPNADTSKRKKGGREKRKASIRAATTVAADAAASSGDDFEETPSPKGKQKKGTSKTEEEQAKKTTTTTKKGENKKANPGKNADKSNTNVETKKKRGPNKKRTRDTSPSETEGNEENLGESPAAKSSKTADSKDTKTKSAQKVTKSGKPRAKPGPKPKAKKEKEKEDVAYKTTSKALQILEQRRADGKLDDAPEDASNERKHMHELCEVQNPSREQALQFLRILARQPSSSLANIDNIRCEILKIHQENYSGPVRRRHTRDLVGTDKRFCTPVLFTSERPHPNRHMWMGPPQSPSKTPVKDQIPKVLKAADEEEPVSTSATSKKAANTSEEQADEEPEEADDQDPRLQQVEPQFEMPRPAQLSGIDDYLDFVGKTYYPNTEQPVCNDEFVYLRRTTLGMLCTQLRPPLVIDKWSPYEVAVFESAICLFGKNFGRIASLIRTKSATEVSEFFYVWKMSKNYLRWRQSFKSPELPFKST